MLPILSVRIFALVTRHAMRMRHVILLLSIIFLHIVSQSLKFSEKKNVMKIKCIFSASAVSV